MRDEIQGNGQDGFHIAQNGDGEWKDQSAWIALEPTQIKSASGNSGDFDSSNPDIRLSTRKTAPERAETLISKKTADFAPLEKLLKGASKAGRLDRLTEALLVKWPLAVHGKAMQIPGYRAIRSTATVLGLALSRDFAARQRVSLVGQKVNIPLDGIHIAADGSISTLSQRGLAASGLSLAFDFVVGDHGSDSCC